MKRKRSIIGLRHIFTVAFDRLFYFRLGQVNVNDMRTTSFYIVIYFQFNVIDNNYYYQWPINYPPITSYFNVLKCYCYATN